MYTVIEIQNPLDATVVRGVALDNETGETVIFGADWRPAAAIAEALSHGEDVEVELEEWQILGRHSVAVKA